MTTPATTREALDTSEAHTITEAHDALTVVARQLRTDILDALDIEADVKQLHASVMSLLNVSAGIRTITMFAGTHPDLRTEMRNHLESVPPPKLFNYHQLLADELVDAATEAADIDLHEKTESIAAGARQALDWTHTANLHASLGDTNTNVRLTWPDVDAALPTGQVGPILIPLRPCLHRPRLPSIRRW